MNAYYIKNSFDFYLMTPRDLNTLYKPINSIFVHKYESKWFPG